MSYKRILIASLTVGTFIATMVLSACTVTRRPDGTIIAEPASGRPVKIPPQRVSQIHIEGECYYQFEGQDGILYCFPCDLEGKGYAEPCSSLLRNNSSGTDSSHDGDVIKPMSIPSFKEQAFMSLFSEWMQQEGISSTHDAIWFHFGLDQWVDEQVADVPVALAKLDDAEDGFIKIMMITRTDWQYPDNTNGASLEYYFLRDASDDMPDAMVLQLSGTFQQVADSMKAFFSGVFTYETSYDGHSILIIGDDSLVSFIVDGTTVWEG